MCLNAAQMLYSATRSGKAARRMQAEKNAYKRHQYNAESSTSAAKTSSSTNGSEYRSRSRLCDE